MEGWDKLVSSIHISIPEPAQYRTEAAPIQKKRIQKKKKKKKQI